MGTTDFGKVAIVPLGVRKICSDFCISNHKPQTLNPKP